jgi:hypothetical protein
MLTGGSALHVKHAVHFGTNSAFAVGPKKTMKSLDRVGQSQDLPASTPALKHTNRNVVFLSRAYFVAVPLGSPFRPAHAFGRRERLWPGPTEMSLELWLPVMSSSVLFFYCLYVAGWGGG